MFYRIRVLRGKMRICSQLPSYYSRGFSRAMNESLPKIKDLPPKTDESARQLLLFLSGILEPLSPAQYKIRLPYDAKYRRFVLGRDPSRCNFTFDNSKLFLSTLPSQCASLLTLNALGNEHCAIRSRQSKDGTAFVVTVQDLDSTNGTYV
jgi:hypothetical protein